ncbi:unnamed protein product [Oppiella nova]|uniref:Cytosolic fatty-acid binding proteins domain-containing protein n=1 Tax=Oppiella nova TaxID=334625 RepID=A0A7R9QP14_9ACAR|nr:unnamed protein product [Oppiella nova]CAG2170177.1 unnamed protein product [Oppiella nova]
MTDFSGRFKLTSSDNFDALLKELGVSDDVVNQLKGTTQEYEITKDGDVFTQKSITGDKVHETKFELGKEFNEIRQDGKTVQSQVVADGNRLIQTQKGDREVKFDALKLPLLEAHWH